MAKEVRDFLWCYSYSPTLIHHIFLFRFLLLERTLEQRWWALLWAPRCNLLSEVRDGEKSVTHYAAMFVACHDAHLLVGVHTERYGEICQDRILVQCHWVGTRQVKDKIMYLYTWWRENVPPFQTWSIDHDLSLTHRSCSKWVGFFSDSS